MRVSNRKDSENKAKGTPCDDQHGENDDEGGERINVVAVSVVKKQPGGNNLIRFIFVDNPQINWLTGRLWEGGPDLEVGNENRAATSAARTRARSCPRRREEGHRLSTASA